METVTINLFVKTIHNRINTLVGLEYIIEFIDCDKILYPFFCTLCDESVLLFNLSSHQHNINYLEQNFPTVMKSTKSSEKFKNDSIFCESFLSKITHKLQKFLKVPKIKMFNLNVFKSCKSYIVDSIKNTQKHFNEKQHGEISIHLQGIDLTEELRSNCCVMDFGKSSVQSRLKRFYEGSRSIESKVYEIYKNYHKSPESHPRYSHEWHEFYFRRCSKICTTKNSSNSSDWVDFWTIRIVELKYEEISHKKSQLQEELNLTAAMVQQDFDEKMIKIIGRSKNSYLKEHEDDGTIETCLRDPSIPRKPRPKKCFIAELHYQHDNEILDAERYRFDSPGTVFSVCRQVLAFSDILPAFVDGIKSLYIKSAEMEKKRYYLSEELLMDQENMMLFSTVKEKLKEALTRNAIDEWKIRCAQRTVQQMNALIFGTEFAIKWRAEKEMKRKKRNSSESSFRKAFGQKKKRKI